MNDISVCPVCPRHCRLAEGMTGACRARARRGGRIESLSYGRLTSLALDPVEKKPFARWHRGKSILSAGTFGCSLHCPFCQNHSIAQAGEEARTERCPPERLAALAAELVPRGNVGVAFTYNEPLVGCEYVRDTARLVKAAGLSVALVTNGMAEAEAVEELLPLVDAMNIDLKGWTQKYYDWLGGDLETVKRTILLASRECHVEVTTLIVPGKNDDPAEMDDEAAWLASLSPDIPLHVTRCFPRFLETSSEPTPVETIERLAAVARRHLRYVYRGNC